MFYFRLFSSNSIYKVTGGAKIYSRLISNNSRKGTAGAKFNSTSLPFYITANSVA
jgi:hypothetical protein